MGVIGVVVVRLWGEGLSSWNHPPATLEAWKIWISPLLSAGVLLSLALWFEDLFFSFREMRRVVASLLGALPLGALWWLAFVSAVGEEVLFRGAIQPWVGLVGTSLLFGALHVGPQGLFGAWSLWAAIAGFLLGWIYQRTGVLAVPILAHFLVNAVSLTMLRRDYLSFGLSESDLDESEEGDAT